MYEHVARSILFTLRYTSGTSQNDPRESESTGVRESIRAIKVGNDIDCETGKTMTRSLSDTILRRPTPSPLPRRKRIHKPGGVQN